MEHIEHICDNGMSRDFFQWLLSFNYRNDDLNDRARAFLESKHPKQEKPRSPEPEEDFNKQFEKLFQGAILSGLKTLDSYLQR